MTERIEKINEIFANEELINAMLSIEQLEEAQKWFSDHGVEISPDELQELGDKLDKFIKGEQDKGCELSEEEMESISGGFIYIPGSEEEYKKIVEWLKKVLGIDD